MKSESVFYDIAEKTRSFWKKEKRFFKKLSDKKISCTDMDLNNELLKIQHKIFGDANSNGLIRAFFQSAMGSCQIGYEFQNAQFIAELFESDYGQEILVFQDHSERERIDSLLSAINEGVADSKDFKLLNRMVAERLITVSNADILVEMALQEIAPISLPHECFRCLIAAASIF